MEVSIAAIKFKIDPEEPTQDPSLGVGGTLGYRELVIQWLLQEYDVGDDVKAVFTCADKWNRHHPSRCEIQYCKQHGLVILQGDTNYVFGLKMKSRFLWMSSLPYGTSAPA